MSCEDLPGSDTSHEMPFSRELYIEQEDFMEQAPNSKYFRLALGKEVRLKNAYIIKCERVEKDENGNITAVILHLRSAFQNRRRKRHPQIKGTLHWVDAATAVPTVPHLRLPAPEDEGDFMERLNPNSMQVLSAKLNLTFSAQSRGTASSSCAWAIFAPTPRAFRRAAHLQ